MADKHRPLSCSSISQQEARHLCSRASQGPPGESIFFCCRRGHCSIEGRCHMLPSQSHRGVWRELCLCNSYYPVCDNESPGSPCWRVTSCILQQMAVSFKMQWETSKSRQYISYHQPTKVIPITHSWCIAWFHVYVISSLGGTLCKSRDLFFKVAFSDLISLKTKSCASVSLPYYTGCNGNGASPPVHLFPRLCSAHIE